LRLGASPRAASHALVCAGMPSGVLYDQIGYWAKLNDAGQVLTNSLLTGNGVDDSNREGFFLWDALGNVTLVQRNGDHAPGTPTGTFFASLLNDPFTTFVLNNAGQVALSQRLGGAGVDSTNDHGIWATDETGALQLVARKGDELEVAPSDFRTISDLTLVSANGHSNGWISGFNNVGQIAFWASFTDGTQGVFVSNKVATVPGDFNFDGTVDAADYVAWRKGLRTLYSPSHYDIWRANFGSSLGSGSGSALPSAESLSAAVPEPATLALLILAATSIWPGRQRTVM